MFEYLFCRAIEQYHKRVKWLLEGSKKVIKHLHIKLIWTGITSNIKIVFQLFGLVKGDRVGVLMDSSDANTGFGRLQDFQQALLVSCRTWPTTYYSDTRLNNAYGFFNSVRAL